MNKILYTYKFRLQPDNNQIIKLSQHFGAIRWTYNHFLNQRKEYYDENKKSLNYNNQSALLTQLKQQEETIWLKDINSQSLQSSLKNLDTAYSRFFKKLADFPRFKSKKGKNSFTVPQYVDIKKDILLIPKFREGIKIISNKKVEGIIKHCTLSITPTGKYFVSILVEKEYEPVQKTNKIVGIDLGLKDFLITSDGTKVKNHRYIKKYERILKLNQQHLSKKQQKSKRREKQRIKVAKIHEKITNSRNDNLHKISIDLIKKYDIIFLEDLNIKGLIKNYKLSKHISDVSWSHFINLLEYKAKWNDKQVIKIDRFYPSSKSCNCCGWIKQDLTLKDRTWICDKCSEKHDRDLNAAKNILKEGLRITSVGTTDYEHRAKIRLDLSSASNEVFKEKEQLVLETNTSLV